MEIAQAIQLLSSTDIAQRGRAAETLATCGEEITAAIVPLIRATKDADETIFEWAVSALEECGPPAGSDLAALVKLVGDSEELPAYWAATLIGRFGEEGSDAGVAVSALAVSALAAALDEHTSMAVKQRAAWALGKLGASALAARSSLETATRADDPRLQRLAQQALENL